MDTRKDKEVRTLIAAAIEGTLTEQQAEALSRIDPELIKLAFLATAKRIAEQDTKIVERDATIADLQAKLVAPAAIHPSTPSGQRPVYTKPTTPKRKKKPGARKGHKPARRARPEHIDEKQEHRLERCPDCAGELQRCNRTRTRTIEDILEDLKTVVTEHIIHRDYCPACKKHVEPVVADALPKSFSLHRAVISAKASSCSKL